MNKWLCIICFSLLFLVVGQDASAQCAMCGSTVNTAANEGHGGADGLNTGILYMLAVPYLALAGIGLLWYRKYRRRNIPLKMEERPISLN